MFVFAYLHICDHCTVIGITDGMVYTGNMLCLNITTNGFKKQYIFLLGMYIFCINSWMM